MPQNARTPIDTIVSYLSNFLEKIKKVASYVYNKIDGTTKYVIIIPVPAQLSDGSYIKSKNGQKIKIELNYLRTNIDSYIRKIASLLNIEYNLLWSVCAVDRIHFSFIDSNDANNVVIDFFRNNLNKDYGRFVSELDKQLWGYYKIRANDVYKKSITNDMYRIPNINIYKQPYMHIIIRALWIKMFLAKSLIVARSNMIVLNPVKLGGALCIEYSELNDLLKRQYIMNALSNKCRDYVADLVGYNGALHIIEKSAQNNSEQ